MANNTYLTMLQSLSMDNQICVRDHQPINFNNLQLQPKIVKIRLGLPIDLKTIAGALESDKGELGRQSIDLLAKAQDLCPSNVVDGILLLRLMM